MSHELRTPVAALMGYGELLADEVLGPLAPAQSETVERMRTVTSRLAMMVDTMLSFSNLDAGRERVVFTRFAPAAIVQEVAQVMGPLALQHDVEFSSRVASSLPECLSDATKVRQILLNLCDNAIKFTPTGGHVVLSAEAVYKDTHDGADVVFAVRDTGIGIAPADLPRLFKPFTQVDAGLTRRYGGAGLGLYISNRLADLLGGRIEVVSAPGGGATFSLIIPTQVSH